MPTTCQIDHLYYFFENLSHFPSRTDFVRNELIDFEEVAEFDENIVCSSLPILLNNLAEMQHFTGNMLGLI
jgi:hypothetical protein